MLRHPSLSPQKSLNKAYHKEKVARAATSLEAQIDRLVYPLYGLPHAEVLVVDPEFGLSVEEYETKDIEGHD